MTEEKLQKGHSTEEVVKIGNTVHRSIGAHSEFIHKLLKLLEDKNFQYAPKYLGTDEKGREILTYFDGDIARGDTNWSIEQLIEIVDIIKVFHNTTLGSDLTEEKEVVCHNDLAPWNLVINNSKVIGFIDFDDATPGNRIDDFAYFLWTFLEIGKEIDPGIQSEKIKVLNERYGKFNTTELIDAILAQQSKILKKRFNLSKEAPTSEERNLSSEKIDIIKGEIGWVKRNREIIEDILNS